MLGKGVTGDWKNYFAPELNERFEIEVLSKLKRSGLAKKEKTNSGYKHNKKVLHVMLNLTFRMLRQTSSEVAATKYDKI